MRIHSGGCLKIIMSNVLSKEELISLNKSEYLTPFSHIIFRIILHAALISCALLAFQGDHFLIFFVLFLLHSACLQFLGYAGLSHELFHGKVFPQKRLNRTLYLISSYVLWNNPAFFEISHKVHHINTFSEKDMEATIQQSFRPLDIFFYCLIDIRMMARRSVYLVLNSAGRTISFNPIQIEHIPDQNASVTMHARRIAILQTGILIALILSGGLMAGIIFWCAPFTATFPNRLLAAAQHTGLADHKENGPLLFSRTLILPRWLSILYAGMNYHGEHHLFPSIPYYRLSELHQKLQDKGHLQNTDSLEFFRRRFWRIVKSETAR